MTLLRFKNGNSWQNLVMPIANGGTGATTVADARKNLGLGSLATINSPLPIANGGTGATTATQAIKNLHSVFCTEVYWGPYYTCTCSGCQMIAMVGQELPFVIWNNGGGVLADNRPPYITLSFSGTVDNRTITIATNSGDNASFTVLIPSRAFISGPF